MENTDVYEEFSHFSERTSTVWTEGANGISKAWLRKNARVFACERARHVSGIELQFERLRVAAWAYRVAAWVYCKNGRARDASRTDRSLSNRRLPNMTSLQDPKPWPKPWTYTGPWWGALVGFSLGPRGTTKPW